LQKHGTPCCCYKQNSARVTELHANTFHTIMITDIWDIRLSSVLALYQDFGSNYSLHAQFRISPPCTLKL
jgi:hypothetical protein